MSNYQTNNLYLIKNYTDYNPRLIAGYNLVTFDVIRIILSRTLLIFINEKQVKVWPLMQFIFFQ